MSIRNSGKSRIKLIRYALIALWSASFISINARSQVATDLPLQFEGSRIIGNNVLLEVANKCRTEQSRSSSDSTAIVDYCLYEVRSFMTAKGYLQATLGKPVRKNTDSGWVINVAVNEGARYRLRELLITGARQIPVVNLREMLKLKRDDYVDEEALKKWLFESVKRSYSELGYIQYTADVQPTFKVTEGGTDGSVDLDVTIHEGEKFHLGTVKFTGRAEIPEEFLLSQMLIQQGDVFSSKLTSESLDRICQTGLFEPIDAEKDVAYQSVRDSHIVNLTVHLRRKQ